MKYVATRAQLEEVVEHYLKQDAFVFDVETVGEHRGDPRRNRVMWISLATHGRADVIPMGHPHGELIRYDYPLKPSGLARQEKGLPLRKSDYSTAQAKAVAVWTPAPEQLSPAEVFEILEPLLFSTLKKGGHNVKFDITTVAKYYGGRIMPGPFFDTMVAAQIIFNTHRPAKAPYNKPYALNSVLHRELGFDLEKGIGKQVEIHGFIEVAKYSLRDSRYDWLLQKELESQLVTVNMVDLMELEMEVLEALCYVETEPAGAPVDLDALRSLDIELGDMLIDIRGRAYKAAGKEFNLGSSQQVQAILFAPKKDGGQGLKPIKLTPGGFQKKKTVPGFRPALGDYSTDKEALSWLASNDVVDTLLEYSEVDKLHGTYVKAYLKDAPDLGGKIFADFTQTTTETGRFSCRAPNLQNVPNARTELGKKVRSLFVANTSRESGSKLVVADYSQIEPRIIASFSQDEVMLDAYLNDKDLYEALASPLGLDRNAGKVGVLSMAYGVGPAKFSKDLGVPEAEGKMIQDKMSKQFAGMTRYKAEVVREAKKRRPPYVLTYAGRRRYLPALFSDNFGTRLAAERQAFNTVIQGSAADIIKMAMVRLHSYLRDEIPEARILLQVHDELVTKCPEDKTDLCVEIVREAMEGIDVLKVPLVADIKVVDRWSDAK